LQAKIISFINKNSDSSHSVQKISDEIEAAGSQEEVFHICLHLSANQGRGIKKTGSGPLDAMRFQAV
ncbi:MAG: hypothetical protein ACI8QI_001051, partial [Limisphaerales bacterium]